MYFINHWMFQLGPNTLPPPLLQAVRALGERTLRSVLQPASPWSEVGCSNKSVLSLSKLHACTQRCSTSTNLRQLCTSQHQLRTNLLQVLGPDKLPQPHRPLQVSIQMRLEQLCREHMRQCRVQAELQKCQGINTDLNSAVRGT